jgi:hypothetical protein
MNRAMRSVLLFVMMVAACGTPGAGATTLVRMSLDQLAQASSVIARARVVNRESRWNGQHTQIVTLTTVALNQTLKGKPASTLVIEQPGGVVGRIRSYVPGTAILYPQAEYVLFLEPSSPDRGRYRLVGMAQGAFRVYRDAATRQERVILPRGSVSAAPRSAGRLAGSTVPFEQFRQAVAATVVTPVTIPPGTSIPVEIRSATSSGVGRMDLEGRVTSDLFPSRGVLIPAGSAIYGTAEKLKDTWNIRWTELSTRGVRIAISARSQESAQGSLQGRILLVTVK